MLLESWVELTDFIPAGWNSTSDGDSRPGKEKSDRNVRIQEQLKYERKIIIHMY